MIKLLILQWLPASGKTTYAKELVDKHWYKRVNKDDLRSMIDNSEWSEENENHIKKIRDKIVEYYLVNGNNVVVDDTNFATSNIDQLKAIAKNASVFISKDIDVEIKFIDTPLYECLERDARRDNPVGKKIIMDMYKKYIGLYREEERPLDINFKIQSCIICDVDWTLAYSPHRSPYDYTKVIDDLPNKHLIHVIRSMRFVRDTELFIFSGRDDSCIEETKEWLNKHDINNFKLVMRNTGDKRSDEIVKKEMYEKHIKDKYNVLAVFDDRPRVIRMWKEQKLMVFDVNRQDPRIDF